MHDHNATITLGPSQGNLTRRGKVQGLGMRAGILSAALPASLALVVPGGWATRARQHHFERNHTPLESLTPLQLHLSGTLAAKSR